MSDDQLRTLTNVHRNLKEYRLGRSIQLMLKNLSTLRRQAHRSGYKRNNFQDRLAQLVVLIKNQDRGFNLAPHDTLFITKRSIHQKNSHLWTTQALDLNTEFVALLLCAKTLSLCRRSRRVCCKKPFRSLRRPWTTKTIKNVTSPNNNNYQNVCFFN